ncbi:EscF/YscF/HrpA family type III secretion system needle major subunit, partial [Salmonella enterica]|nr:EscF/YscF/HrpA family type III secretion system needle major subunit [Salmonella enterica subsp. enterica serovar Kentucky]ECW2425909.1 EscF/YscF/HrpA family type III secretion system needle major subunit [Salmonella enterica]ECX6565123.1 EscF/YscF/HrpA family type III secretion system needle major subunit [Salmonella enterica subsp. enterica serovar Virchow]EDV3152372.1 EscF/YscF/HrpA family type III secretion system needle major subunit [Salmonella enterica subsp. enterica serovar Chandans]
MLCCQYPYDVFILRKSIMDIAQLVDMLSHMAHQAG